ncbi:MAG: hypothetical protein Q9208_000928 [Pyrenodesmia sp. 3 TL-2023]
MPERYGAALRFLRHGHLHSGLLEHLNATEGHPIQLNLTTEIAGIDCEEGTIRRSDGTCVQKDLIVLANGLGCRFLSLITGKDCPLRDTGLSFFRYLAPAQEFLDDPETRPLFENQEGDFCFFQNFATATSVVTYLCESGQTRAISVFAKPPSEGVTAGRVAVIGDAAHLFRPQQGQGASSAIESAGCLEVLFAGTRREDVQPRLKLFEQLRLRRCGPMHVFSNMLPGPDGYAWMLEKIKPFWDDPARPLPPPGSRPMSFPFREFMYAYDIREESRKALAGYQQQKRSESHPIQMRLHRYLREILSVLKRLMRRFARSAHVHKEPPSKLRSSSPTPSPPPR